MELKFFYIFSILALLSAGCVIIAKNPIHSILFLVFVFFFVSGLLILLNVEFLAMLLIIVYVGAVAVLFLFVIMMLNVKIYSTYENISRYLPIGFVLSLVFLFEFYLIIKKDLIAYDLLGFDLLNNLVGWLGTIVFTSNTTAIGTILYTYYSFYFILCGYILLISMIGAIILTLFRRGDLRRQEVYKQVKTNFRNSVNFSKR
jgi:NADH-quinone oxidoreductase subunit J|uniref:NADH-ubiquinone oxidoreductase chain 6 n=1 Tax=Baffinella frigidus TaxID=2571260 RepID=A0A6C0X6A6_9CRYP|nr:NADH dehydrogenase subunit 6 [Cryptophyta sp. CCMP2293]